MANKVDLARRGQRNTMVAAGAPVVATVATVTRIAWQLSKCFSMNPIEVGLVSRHAAECLNRTATVAAGVPVAGTLAPSCHEVPGSGQSVWHIFTY